MEDKIKVGEYVKFNNGEIGKVIDIKENPKRVVYSEYGEIALCSSIVKHSKQLIDLIEVGDIVNGYRVISVDYDVMNDTTECIELDLNSNYQYNFISIRQIQTILTKEQYMANCYKVGGENER